MATVFGNYFKQRVDGAGRSAATKAARSKKRRASKLATSGARVTQKSKQATVGAGSATSHPAGTATVGGGTDGRPSSAKRRRKRAGQSSAGVGAGSPPQGQKPVRLAQKWDPVRASARHTFHTVASDHAETPAAAYADIAPFLEALAHARGVSKKKLRVYDPYYCDGAAKRRLVAMGFRATIHENRDFYADVDAGSVPTHDVLMTNPPFSGDHIERLVRFVTRGAGAGRRLPSFALLVPSYVIGKPYWRECVKSLAPPPFVVAAQRRYQYEPPTWAASASTQRSTTSPFESLWLVWSPTVTSPMPAWRTAQVRVWRSYHDVPRSMRDVTDPSFKRPNPKARRRAAERARKARAAATAVAKSS